MKWTLMNITDIAALNGQFPRPAGEKSKGSRELHRPVGAGHACVTTAQAKRVFNCISTIGFLS